MSNQLVAFIGWTFIPRFATQFVQSVYYGITIRAGEAKPQPGSPRHARHYRRIQITLIIFYLLFTIYDAYHDVYLKGNFYRALGVPHDANDRLIKSRFRRLAAVYHPDRLGNTKSNPVADAHFVHLKLAQDTLLHPVQRFAYDRFGPDALEWQHCTTISDYVFAGLAAYGPAYAGSAIVLVLLGVTGYLQWGNFWRYLTYGFLAILELYTLTRPYFPPFLVKVINPALELSFQPAILPFQLLVLARKLALTIFIAVSQLGAHFQAGGPEPPSDTVNLQTLNQLEHYARMNEAEVSRLLQLGMAPYEGDKAGKKDLKEKIQEWLVQNTIRSDPMVREAVGEELRKRQE